jgi:hypothetical protein
LALEIATLLLSTNCAVGNSPADPRDEHRQPVVGHKTQNTWPPEIDSDDLTACLFA